MGYLFLESLATATGDLGKAAKKAGALNALFLSHEHYTKYYHEKKGVFFWAVGSQSTGL